MVVVGAVLLDMYRNKRASEVKITTPADEYREQKLSQIEDLRQEMEESKEAGDQQRASEVKNRIAAENRELKETYKKMKAEEKAEQARVRAEERESERRFQEMLKQKSRTTENTSPGE